MSAREKLLVLEQQAKTIKEEGEEEKGDQLAQFQEEERAREARNELHKQTLPAAESEHSKLFGQFKKTGLVTAIEELTDQQVFPPRRSKINIGGYPVKPFNKQAEGRRGKEWQVDDIKVAQTPDGSCERGVLRLQIHRDHYDLYGNRQPTISSIDWVKVSYYSNRRLVISGENNTFNHIVDHRNPNFEQTGAIETGLALAFYQPLKEWYGSFGETLRKQKRSIDVLKAEFGDILGQALGDFVYSYDSETKIPHSIALARATVVAAQGSEENLVRALAGMIVALTTETQDQIAPSKLIGITRSQRAGWG